MRHRLAALGVALGALPAVAHSQPEAAGTLTATAIRAGDHPAHVRVVVDFTGRRVLAGEVMASDPDPFRDGAVRLALTRRGIRGRAAGIRRHGVWARLVERPGRLDLRLDARPQRFKYVGYAALHDPERLVVDLWKSRVRSNAAEIRRAPDGCLSLGRTAVSPTRVRASGRERRLFEHSLVVRLRRAGGRIHAQRHATAAAGRWSVHMAYRPAARQTGTLEAVAESAKDGTLDCLVQTRVRFGG